MLPEKEDKYLPTQSSHPHLNRHSSYLDHFNRFNTDYQLPKMSPRPPFLSASDYVFYLRRQVEKEKEEAIAGGDYGKENAYNGSSCSSLGLSIESPKISELLRKLDDDLRLVNGSFVEDFAEEPNNGISWVLDLLRISLNKQQHCPGMNTSSPVGPSSVVSIGSSNNKEESNKSKMVKSRERQHQLKRAMTDEFDCLLCLKHATSRNTKILQKIIGHRNGLSTLATCIVSNLTKSRLIAIELLTKACHCEPDGGKKVLEAMSTLRVIFGESVRFKLLVAILNSGANGVTSSGLESVILSFLNAILTNASPNPAERIRLQCELSEAGLDVKQLEQKLKEKRIPADDPIWSELKQYKSNYVDIVEILKEKRLLTRETIKLRDEIDLLQASLTKLEEDKITLMEIERELKEKCEDLEQEVASVRHRLATLTSSATAAGTTTPATTTTTVAKSTTVPNSIVPKYKLQPSSSSSSSTPSSASPLSSSTSSSTGPKATLLKVNSGRPGSDSSDPISATGDSGRWSDSDNCEGSSKVKPSHLLSPLKVFNKASGSNNSNSHNNIKNNSCSSKKSSSTDKGLYDQNVRNEDIFIYIPSIRPTAFNYSDESLPHSDEYKSSRKLSRNQSCKEILRSSQSPTPPPPPPAVGDELVRESRWMLRQRPNIDKPTVIEVYPKKNKPEPSKSDLSSSSSILGNDRDENELILDFNYPSQGSDGDEKGHTSLTALFRHEPTSRRTAAGLINNKVNGKQSNNHNNWKKLSSSMNQLNDLKQAQNLESLVNDDHFRTSEISGEFFLKTRNSTSTTSLNNSTTTPTQSLMVKTENTKGTPMAKSGSKHNLNNYGSKSKKFASSLQSYFFSGSLHKGKKGSNGHLNHQNNHHHNNHHHHVNGNGNHSNQNGHNSTNNSGKKKCINGSVGGGGGGVSMDSNLSDSGKSFPLPNVYKKNFISRGHGNCGLYSGIRTNNKDSGHVYSKSELEDELSRMVHKEIASAAKDLVAPWF